MEFRAVILAAGESRRMGAQKLLMPYRGRPMIEHALEAARRWKPVIVAGAQVAGHVRAMNADVVLNESPQRGMTHSLALANAQIPENAALIVLLGDKPLVTPQLIEQIAGALGDADVVFPVHPRTREPGHPVIFSPRARERIPLLPDADALRTLRDDPALVRREIATEDRGAYFDIDTADTIA